MSKFSTWLHLLRTRMISSIQAIDLDASWRRRRRRRNSSPSLPVTPFPSIFWDLLHIYGLTRVASLHKCTFLIPAALHEQFKLDERPVFHTITNLINGNHLIFSSQTQTMLSETVSFALSPNCCCSPRSVKSASSFLRFIYINDNNTSITAQRNGTVQARGH